MYLGSEEEGRKVLASVYALNASTISTTMVPWNQILEAQGFGLINAALCEKNKTVDYYGVTFRNFSAPAYQTVFEQLSALFNAIPDARGSTIQIETFSNIAQAAVPEDSTAYPWRDALGHVYVSPPPQSSAIRSVPVHSSFTLQTSFHVRPHTCSFANTQTCSVTVLLILNGPARPAVRRKLLPPWALSCEIPLCQRRATMVLHATSTMRTGMKRRRHCTVKRNCPDCPS